MPIGDDKELADELFERANERAKGYGLKFGVGARQDVQAMAVHAAHNLRTAALNRPPDAPPGADAEYLRTAMPLAAEAFYAFVDQMVAARKALPGYAKAHPGEIGEETFRRARSILCPLWPICD